MAANAFERAAPPGAITHPPSSSDYLVDRGFRLLAVCGASLIILLVAYILWKIGGLALPAKAYPSASGNAKSCSVESECSDRTNHERNCSRWPW